MINREVRNSLLLSLLGIVLFFLSFHVGESSILGGIMHLSGCAFFCTGVHGIHDAKMEEEIHPHPHH
jgi:hypothetical protein